MTQEDKLNSLDEEFKPLVEQLLAALPFITTRVWVIVSARRTIKEQEDIYAQGRTKPGQVVSNAKPGYSAHNYGCAVDLAPLKAGRKTGDIDWNAPRVMWENMADLAEEMGLTAGAHFQTITDLPHVEHPKWKTLRDKWKKGELQVA